MSRTAGPNVSRPTNVTREVRAGCTTCSGTAVRWEGGSAQGTAAQHHDQTGHDTWADVTMMVRYGTDAGTGALKPPGKRTPGPDRVRLGQTWRHVPSRHTLRVLAFAEPSAEARARGVHLVARLGPGVTKTMSLTREALPVSAQEWEYVPPATTKGATRG